MGRGILASARPPSASLHCPEPATRAHRHARHRPEPSARAPQAHAAARSRDASVVDSMVSECHGGSAPTPHLDKLAEGGAKHFVDQVGDLLHRSSLNAPLAVDTKPQLDLEPTVINLHSHSRFHTYTDTRSLYSPREKCVCMLNVPRVRTSRGPRENTGFVPGTEQGDAATPNVRTKDAAADAAEKTSLSGAPPSASAPEMRVNSPAHTYTRNVHLQ